MRYHRVVHRIPVYPPRSRHGWSDGINNRSDMSLGMTAGHRCRNRTATLMANHEYQRHMKVADRIFHAAKHLVTQHVASVADHE